MTVEQFAYIPRGIHQANHQLLVGTSVLLMTIVSAIAKTLKDP
jgi:hypothetical protein